MKGDPHIRQRPDGFWEVSGSAGHHSRADAVRVARQIGKGLRAGRKNRQDAIDPRTTPPGEVFQCYDPDVVESTEELPPVDTAATTDEDDDGEDEDDGEDDDGEDDEAETVEDETHA